MSCSFSSIPGFQDYMVSSAGYVWSFRRGNKWKRLRGRTDSYGYLQVDLRRGRGAEVFLVHRLVLEAFVGPCPFGMECCHKNGVRNDNRLSNLRWGTPSSNVQDSIRHGTRVRNFGSLNPAARLDENKVFRLRRMRATGKYTAAELSLIFGVSIYAVREAYSRRTWSHI